MSARKQYWDAIAKKLIGKEAVYRGGDGQFAFVTRVGRCTTLYGRLERRRANARRKSMGRGVAVSADRGLTSSSIFRGGGLEKRRGAQSLPTRVSLHVDLLFRLNIDR